MLSSHHTCYPTSSASLICPFLSILSLTAQSHTLITSFLEPHNSPQLQFRSSPFTSKRPYIVLQNEPYYYRAMSHHSNPLSLTLLAGEERLQDPFHLAQTYILALSSLVSMCTLLKKKKSQKTAAHNFMLLFMTSLLLLFLLKSCLPPWPTSKVTSSKKPLAISSCQSLIFPIQGTSGIYYVHLIISNTFLVEAGWHKG